MDELADIKQALANSAEALALDLFGEPQMRRGQQWRYGSKGSVVVGVAGRWRGRFYSFEAEVGGSLLDAIMFALCCDFKDAVAWARSWLGHDRPAKPRRPVIANVDTEEPKRRDSARNIWAASKKIVGTAAETYLRGRGINPDEWPDAVRWHRQSGAAIFASTAPDGTISAIQRVYLHRDGTAKTNDGRKIKRSLGPRYGGAVRINGDQRALCLAEGPETALSTWYATGIETWAGLGAVGSIDLSPVPIARAIIVCKDDDAKGAPSRKAQHEAIWRWRREGRTVYEVLPHERSRRDKSDFNNALQEGGPEAVAARIEAVLSDQAVQREAMPLSQARKTLGDATRDALSELRGLRFASPPPALALKVSLGLGKTEQALTQALQWIEDGKGPVVYAVPTHKLSAEILERANILADGRIRIAVWRGREADDPEAEGEQMCRDIDTIREVQRVGGHPQTMVCINGDKRCPFANFCGYQKQRNQIAELWIVAHATLFFEKPEAIPWPYLVIIDEGFWQAGLRGVLGHPIIVSDHQISLDPYVPGSDRKTADLLAELMPIRRKLTAALASHPDGPISRSTLIEAGLTRDNCIAAAKAERRRRFKLDITPGMDAEKRQKALADASGNTELPRMFRMWLCLANMLVKDGPALSGNLIVEEINDDGARYRGVRLRWHEVIDEGWRAPTLYIDATLDLELVRPYLPQIELRADISAETPYQRVTQYPDRAFSKASLRGDTMLNKVWLWSLAKARAAGGRWLIVAQKDIEEAIRARYEVPDFIDLAHHNAIAGRDEWRDVRGLIVVGRTMPPPKGVQSMASLLSGRHIEVTDSPDGWYASGTATLRDINGNAVTVEVDQAGDPLAEALRRSICEAEIEQIIGRARGVNRTAENPVEIHVLGNVPLSHPVDELAEWVPPSKDDKFFAKSGVWLSSEGDMAEAHGISRNTLHADRLRAKKRMGTVPYKNIYYGNVPNLREAQYQRAGPGRSMQRVVYDPRTIPDIEAFLRAQLGELVAFAEVQPSPELDLLPVTDRVCQTGRATRRSQQSLSGEICISSPLLNDHLQDRYGLPGRQEACLGQPPHVQPPPR